MERNIKNPSLVPEWFIYSGSKVMGVSGADGRQYYFVGSSEKGEDGKTPDIRINEEKGYIWESRYAPGDWNEIPGSPAASGLIGPQGETGPSGDSVKVDSIVNANGGTTVTLAWGENFSATSSFFVPSGLSGANGKDGTDGKDGQNGISPTVTTATIQPDTTHTNGGIEVTISGADGEHKYSAWNGKDGTGASLFAGTDLKIVDGIVQVNTNGIANSAGSAFVEGIDTIASGIASHAAGKNTSAYSDYSFVEGYQNTDYLITGLIGANHTEGAYNQVSGVYSHIEGHANTLIGYGVHMEGGYNIFKSHNLSADKSDPIGRWNIWGQSVEGMANATSAEPTSGTPGQSNFGYVHGGILKIIGNGTRIKTDDSKPESEVITRSDALILYRDGSMMVKGPITANGVELGAGGTSYQGRSGVNVADNYIELTQTAYNALTSVSSKVDKPNTSFVNNYLALRTDNAGNVSGWVDLKDNFYSKSEATGTFVATANIDTTTLSGNGKSESTKLGVNTDVIQTKLTEEQLTAISDVSSKLDKDDLDDYIPFSAISLPIGTNNVVTDYSMGIGYSNTANYGGVNTPIQYGSLAFGYQNSASKMSFAAGNENKALHVGFAVGYHCSATEHAVAMNNNCGANDYSFAEGNNNKANKYSFAGGLNCIADDYSFAYGEATSAIGKSFAYGPANSAYNYSYLIGRGLEYSGASTAGYNIGAFVIGGWNATTSYATTADAPLFIIGNGSTNSNRSDALVLTRDGKLTTNKVFVSGTNFDTLGQSRLDGNNACYGTNWMGVSQSHAGFLKFIDGQNPGDTEISNAGSGIQIEFKPNTTQGELNIINTCTGTPTITKVINVPTASYTNMSTFDSESGPNYMLRKTANGFDIGAAVINTTALPANVQANAYYFIYEM